MKQLFTLLAVFITFSLFSQTAGIVQLTHRKILKDTEGNMGLCLKFLNNSDKTIKQIRISVIPVDSRDENLCDDNGIYSFCMKLNGPVAPGKYASVTEKSLIQDCRDNICCLKVIGMKILFTDQSSIDVAKKDLQKYYAPELGPECPPVGAAQSQTSTF
jgi:hypothetical protein